MRVQVRHTQTQLVSGKTLTWINAPIHECLNTAVPDKFVCAMPDAVAFIRWRRTVASIRIIGGHRNWEDWATMVLGVVIALSPWPAQPSYLGCPTMTDVVWNTMFVGVAVSMFGAVELANLHRWEQIGEMAFGAWLIASPYVFEYAGSGLLQYWHYGLGGAVVLLAVIELWQDWDLSDQQLAHHGT